VNTFSTVLCAVVLLVTGARVTAAAPQRATARRSAAAVPASRGVPAPGNAEVVLGEVVDRLWSRGDFYWHEGRYEERVALDRLLIRMEPRFIEPYGTAGWLLDSMDRDEEALDLYRQAVAVAPQRWETHHDLGMFYYQHKEYPAAANAFRRGTQQQGAPHYVWKMLAHACERMGELEKALAAWEAAARVAPNDPAVAPNLQRVRARLRPPEN
jgi:Flp pilus assembly protein TadD